MKSLIFLDDERNFEDVTWIDYTKYKEVIVLRRMQDFTIVCSNINIEEIKNYDFSFDHDIQDFTNERENTGYDCVKWLLNYTLDNGIDISKTNFYVHSKNPVGKRNIELYISNFKDFFYSEMNNL